VKAGKGRGQPPIFWPRTSPGVRRSRRGRPYQPSVHQSVYGHADAANPSPSSSRSRHFLPATSLFRSSFSPRLPQLTDDICWDTSGQSWTWVGSIHGLGWVGNYCLFVGWVQIRLTSFLVQTGGTNSYIFIVILPSAHHF